MHRLFSLLAMFVVICIASSCVRKCSGYLKGFIHFTGFDSTALEEVVIKKYTAGDHYIKATDSVVVLLSQSPDPLEYYDTTSRFVRWTGYDVHWPKSTEQTVCYVEQGYDYEISVPNAGKVYRISDMAFADAKSSCSGGSSGADACECRNALEAYKLNGLSVSTTFSGAVYSSGATALIELTR